MEIFRFKKETRIIVLAMIILVLVGLLIAKVYYGNINKSEDPRVFCARNLYTTFSKLNEEGDFDGMLSILDSVQGIYEQYEHYRESYEIGVVYNDKAAIFLTQALQETDSVRMHALLLKAGEYCFQAIEIYKAWKSKYVGLDATEIKSKIIDHFGKDALNVDDKLVAKVLEKRIDDIATAQYEIDRRLSVSYTNLGIAQRHLDEPLSAAESYSKAVELWDENLTAKNNLNRLLGKPIQKRSLFRKLFPPNKDRDN